MKFSRALCAFTLIAAIAFAPAADAQRRRTRTPAPPPAPAVAQHVTIMDGASGAILSCEDCETPIPPASMAKLMTILIVLEQLQAGRITYNTQYSVSEYAWREHGAPSGGSHMFLPVNSSVSVRDLIQGAVIVSANDACVVLAEGIAGSEEAFVAMMNRRAQELGLTSARFRNVTGLDDPEQRISSADLARLARHIIVNYPDFYPVYGRREFTYNNRTQPNRNPLLGAYPGADGVKTGHTDESGYGLVGSAVLNDERRIIVFNGLPTMAARTSEAQRLMRAAFHDFSIATDRRAPALKSEKRKCALVHGARSRSWRRATSPSAAHAVCKQELTAHHRLRAARYIRRSPKAQVVAHLVVEGPGFQTQRFPLDHGRRKIGKRQLVLARIRRLAPDVVRRLIGACHWRSDILRAASSRSRVAKARASRRYHAA
jgi:D-alanyl-D-alanine carboxypeptidase (penicillin-binding protein 5/6)